MSKNILAIGAHSDDVEFGCYGTLIKHKHRGDNITIVIMSKGDVKHSVSKKILRSESESISESIQSAKLFGFKLIQFDYTDTKIPFTVDTISDLERIIVNSNIDTIYTHWGGDTHQDHINTLNSSIAAARMINNVLCYEQIPIPRVSINYPVANYYVDISDVMNKKIEACLCHKSQVDKYLDSGLDMIEGLSILAKYRGNQIGVKYAEAFDLLKMVS